MGAGVARHGADEDGQPRGQGLPLVSHGLFQQGLVILRLGSILLCKQIADREGQFAQNGAHIVLGHSLQGGAIGIACQLVLGKVLGSGLELDHRIGVAQCADGDGPVAGAVSALWQLAAGGSLRPSWMPMDLCIQLSAANLVP